MVPHHGQVLLSRRASLTTAARFLAQDGEQHRAVLCEGMKSFLQVRQILVFFCLFAIMQSMLQKTFFLLDACSNNFLQNLHLVLVLGILACVLWWHE